MREIRQEKSKKKHVHLTLHLITILLLLLLIVLWCSRCAAPQPVVSNNEEAVTKIMEADTEHQQAALNALVEEGQMNVNYLSEATFDGRVSEQFNVKNIKNNHYPIVFELYDEQDDCLYHSGEIEPGYEVNQIQLEKELKTGVHDCKLKVGYSEKGNVSSVFPLTIEVK